MRLLLVLLGCMAAPAAGCQTRSKSLCSPCLKWTTNCPKTTPSCAPCPPQTVPAAPVKPAAPAFLPTAPPTIREVRGPDDGSDLRPRTAPATAVAPSQEVLLVPRWVYVPYSAHVPAGPAKLPSSVAGGHFVPADERMMVPQPHSDTLEQCLQQLKAMNARLSELEARSERPVPASIVSPAAPQMLPLPPVPSAPGS
jgi:hypothetical protein